MEAPARLRGSAATASQAGGPDDPSQPGSATVSGTVPVEADATTFVMSDEELHNINVRRAETSEQEFNGGFVFDDVAPGAYTLMVYVGARIIERPLEIAAGRNDVRVVAD